ncbi:MAG: cation-translocating P-type ATPase [Phycisphaeraceae bacterium]|nr:cation-translocating P-type ATPase [Phycisphaerales bacterium]MCB9859760.1 cation-translocating P-type ATPase [Phycisphaeraceae bacterium]
MSEAAYAELNAGMGAASSEQVGKRTENSIIMYLFGGVLLLVSGIALLAGHTNSAVATMPAMLAAIVLMIPMGAAAFREIREGEPSTSSLAAIAVLAAIISEKYLIAGFLAFVLLAFDQILRRTAWGAQRAIEELIGLTPDVARIVDESGSEREVPLSDVRIGARIRVRPGENLPVDGRVTDGKSTINQASLTGESLPVSVSPGDLVFAGTVNLTGAIELVATGVGADSTIGKVSQLISEAEKSKSPKQLIIEKVARFFFPVAIMVALVVWFMYSQSPDELVRNQAESRAISVLIVTCPAALLLASPSAMVAAFAAAARLGVMIKQSNYLEAAANIDTVVMDKTGTITTGEFAVTRLVPAPGVDGAELLKAAAAAEQKSNHPLALSIMRTAESAKVEITPPTDFEEVHGLGAKATTTEGPVYAGRAKWLIQLNPAVETQLRETEAKIDGITGVHIMKGSRYLGVVGLEDKVKRNTRDIINHLRELGVKQVAIFTGDRLGVAKRVGVAVGVDAIEAECLPEEKHEQIKQLVEQGYHVMMVGDGINDGPSLAEADVGVAMGLAGSDIAANSAGVALMNDELSRLPFLIELSRRTRAIIIQNIAVSILIVVVGLILSAMGLLAVTAAAAYHFVGDVFVIANSFRLFRFGEGVGIEDTGEQIEVKRREASLRGLAATTG